ncbi:MAG: hypothetical protein KF766_08125 [Rhodocyclaceae bacterium]|nr:hypothetical protein [Rhodocyclaceae bacterium]
MIVAILMAAQGMLPIWLAVVIVMRDAIIVAGAVAYRSSSAASRWRRRALSKANTFSSWRDLPRPGAGGAIGRAPGLADAAALLLFASVLVSGALRLGLAPRVIEAPGG